MRMILVIGFALALFSPLEFGPSFVQLAQAQEIQRYTVYCADRRIEVSMWDLEQMMVRRGSNVCQFTSYTSYSDALRFAEENFGGEGTDCTC
jgi:hypothetical protein